MSKGRTETQRVAVVREQQSPGWFEAGAWGVGRGGIKARVETEAWLTQTMSQPGGLQWFQWFFTVVPRPACASETSGEIL